jgi:hypothetical protein
MRLSDSASLVRNAGSIATSIDLQGRKVDANATGLLIKQMRMQDGTTHAVKVMR